MKILLAADGSKFTKKALAFLVTHEGLLESDGELHVLYVQPSLPPRVSSALAREVTQGYYLDEAEKVLAPIRKFLQRHPVTFHADWVVGVAPDEIIKVANREKAHLIVMGTHGHGVLARMVLGSVAQRVVASAEIPVLLVK
jgi:nucleotide-binding universal stress UspA family protein